jgi:hypothetical protein
MGHTTVCYKCPSTQTDDSFLIPFPKDNKRGRQGGSTGRVACCMFSDLHVCHGMCVPAYSLSLLPPSSSLSFVLSHIVLHTCSKFFGITKVVLTTEEVDLSYLSQSLEQASHSWIHPPCRWLGDPDLTGSLHHWWPLEQSPVPHPMVWRSFLWCSTFYF